MDSDIVKTHSSKQLPSEFFQMAHKIVFSQLSLTPREHDILALVLSRLHKDHWIDFINGKSFKPPRYQFSKAVLTEWFGVESKYIHSTLKEPAKRLAGRSIGIANDEKEKFDFTPLFKRLAYEDGVLLAVPNDELMNEYLGLSQGHAKLNNKAFSALKSEHSKRLYSMLSRFKSHKTTLHPQDISYLHGFFGLLSPDGKLVKKSYANNNTFIDRCIRKSIKEIQECEPKIVFEEYIEGGTHEIGFAPIRTGRKITSINFLFFWLADSKDEQKELDRLAEQSPIELIYDLVNGFIPNQDANPTLKELNDLKSGLGDLIAQGKIVDQNFMDKFNMAKAEAELR
jgi:plasmid replication initiation protein